jgi:hypothetical protein
VPDSVSKWFLTGTADDIADHSGVPVGQLSVIFSDATHIDYFLD